MDNDRYEDLMRHGSGIWRSLRDGDFEEEEVWDVLRDGKNDSNSKIGKSVESSISVLRSMNLTSSPRTIPTRVSNGRDGGDDDEDDDDFHRQTKLKQPQQSLPVSIPNWSKICKKKPKKSFKNSSSWHEDDDDDDDEEEDEDNNYKLPPHELISKRLARSQISSFSVFEGAGRTLKGRDLNEVRNAILTKTGFLESP